MRLKVIAFFVLCHMSIFSQQNSNTTAKRDSISPLEEVVVKSLRTSIEMPFTFTEINQEEISTKNLGVDIPTLLGNQTALVSYSDSGNGIGYSGLRIRGVDATRINVTINGVPYNDSESQSTYWVNISDIISSTENIQIQRGVGTSTNGSASFGANINLLTDRISKNPHLSFSNSLGSFNTRKHTLKFSTGIFKDILSVNGRVSKILSDGYIDRSKSDLGSYFLQFNIATSKDIIKLISFGGQEITGQAWFGIDQNQLDKNRRYNPAGKFIDSNGEEKFYDNQVDHYTQHHFQALWTHVLSPHWRSHLTLHYTKGFGYYEEYQDAEDPYAENSLSTYNLPNITMGSQTIDKTDVIRRKWLDNDFYGGILTFNHNSENLIWDTGISTNRYEDDHFGELVWLRHASTSEKDDHYYDSFGNKSEFNTFSKATYFLNKFNFFLDLQYRYISYESNLSEISTQPNLIDKTFHFFNPKVGIKFNIDTQKALYLSFALGNREPNRTDFKSDKPTSESLYDIELGGRFLFERLVLNANLYFMRYNEQLVSTGALDDVGQSIRTNLKDSYRAGIEFSAIFSPIEAITYAPNITVSKNQIENHTDSNENTTRNTTISYSPSIIAGQDIIIKPFKTLSGTLTTKYVGEQYMSNNNEANSKLLEYTFTNININYNIPSHKIMDINLAVSLNNIFDAQYSANGFYYSNTPYYYPQAGFNYLVGLNIVF